MSLKTKFIISLLIILASLVGIIFYQNHHISELNHNIELCNNNLYAYEQENAALNGKTVEFIYTIDQLNASQDSLIQKMNDIRKELDIKDKKIKSLQYLASENNKTEYIVLRDSVFLPGVAIDTTIGDNWSRLAVHAEAPNILNVDYSFNNELLVVFHESKITVKPPKKCWLGRLLQRKQTIVEVEVHQENPYCTNKEQKFVKIIK